MRKEYKALLYVFFVGCLGLITGGEFCGYDSQSMQFGWVIGIVTTLIGIMELKI